MRKAKSQGLSKDEVKLKLVFVSQVLQIHNLDYVYSKLNNAISITKKKERKDGEYMAGIEFFSEVLFVIRDMAS